MGYSTDFKGKFIITPSLDPTRKLYLEKFAETRRVKRSVKVLEKGGLGLKVEGWGSKQPSDFDDPIRKAVDLPVGPEGAYFVGGGGECGQCEDESVVNNNEPPTGQPGLWCQWVPNEDGTAIVWDQGEKFYNYVEWLEYLIKHFFIPWDCVLDGEVGWQGEESDDVGKIIVKENVVTVKKGRVVFD